MTLTDAAEAIVALLRANGLTPDAENAGEFVEYSWSRADGVWLLLSQDIGEPALEVIDQRAHGATVFRRVVGDVLLSPEPFVRTLRSVLT